MSKFMKEFFGVIIGFFALVGLILFIAFCPFTIVSPGENAIITNFGTVKGTLSEGFHWISPFDGTTDVDMRTQKAEADASAASKDLQTVNTKIALNYRFEPSQLTVTYQKVGVDDRFYQKVITPAIQDSVKAATAQFTAEELITKRSEVSEMIKLSIAEKIQPYAVVESVSIINFAFSESFNNAIEAKVTAEQEALAAKNKLEQTKYEAEQAVVKAQAEAESIRIQAQALKESGQLVELEWVRKWNGVLPSTMLSPNSMSLVQIP